MMDLAQILRNGWNVAGLYGSLCSRLMPLLLTGWASGDGRARLKSVAAALGWERAPGRARSVSLASLVSGDAGFRICEAGADKMNVTYFELCCINTIAAAWRPESVFEFGTFDGRTTLNLAVNCPPGASVWTIDLPEKPGTLLGRRLGERFLGRPERAQIHQLQCDTTSFDYSPYYQQMQLIFVDACHEYEFVRSDSTAAMKMADPAGSVILWHDYGTWPGVTRAVDELSCSNAFERNVIRISGTSLAMLLIGTAHDRFGGNA